MFAMYGYYWIDNANAARSFARTHARSALCTRTQTTGLSRGRDGLRGDTASEDPNSYMLDCRTPKSATDTVVAAMKARDPVERKARLREQEKAYSANFPPLCLAKSFFCRPALNDNTTSHVACNTAHTAHITRQLKHTANTTQRDTHCYCPFTK